MHHSLLRWQWRLHQATIVVLFHLTFGVPVDPLPHFLLKSEYEQFCLIDILVVIVFYQIILQFCMLYTRNRVELILDLSAQKLGKIMLEASLKSVIISFLMACVFIAQGCTSGPMRAPTSAGMVVYSKGARQHTATLQIDLPATEVYAAMLRVVAQHPEIKVINQNDKYFLLELTDGERNVTGQATELDSRSTLFFIWADAGNSGQTGQRLALNAVRALCAELKVECQMKGL